MPAETKTSSLSLTVVLSDRSLIVGAGQLRGMFKSVSFSQDLPRSVDVKTVHSPITVWSLAKDFEKPIASLSLSK